MLRVREAWRAGQDGRPGWNLSLHLGAGWEADIAELKAAVPKEDRSYDEGEHLWWFAEAHEEALALQVVGFAGYLTQLEMNL
jgi:hypothetical protein